MSIIDTNKQGEAFIYSSYSISTVKNRIKEKLGFSLIWLSAFIILLGLGSLIFYIFFRGHEYAFSYSYLFSAPQGGRSDGGGILYPLIGTVYLIVCSIAISIPIGICSAIYLSEYANYKSKFIRLADLVIESLAGIPSVIFGLFGLAFFVDFLDFKHSLLSGSMTVAIMILPFIIKTSQESISSVPQSFRDASLALGANKTKTIFRLILPNALPGIFTGVMLSISRAVAESAILILAAGGSITAIPRFFSWEYPFVFPDSGRTLAVHLYYQANSYDNTEKAFATALVLIILIISVNLISLISYYGLSKNKKRKKRNL